MEFHVARGARDRYQFDEALFAYMGNVIIANFHAARIFAQKMNQKRDLVHFPEQAVRASQINAMGLIDEISHHIFRAYREQHNPRLLADSLAWLEARLGRAALDAALYRFADSFPPLAVYRREADLTAFLAGEREGVPHRELVLEELLMLWMSNSNPAFVPFGELFDDTKLEKETAYPQIAAGLYEFFSSQPGFGPGGENIIDVLLAPARAAPHSLEGQLEFLRQHWGALLGRYVYRLLGSMDLIKEEEKPVFFGPGPVEIPVYELGALEAEPEQFTPDRDWMPNLVLIAKNAYVWLDQLAKQYGRSISTLDQVPDEELDGLARWGVTGLWLIGLWERSTASRTIKQIMGNPEAVASAYSLYDYQIAGALGGEEACRNLRERAWRRGIRLASDMVPNHVGIDGRWVIEHPDWFVGLDYSPFPAYSFNGPDLSTDGRVGIFIEDHYYDRSDAAVVFKRVDRWSGSEKYIYHGNDGTSMPWNDTAQLNYLQAEVREAVIQTILHVARLFPIIRFDAAMTLAKKHYQRLWFPEPGSGGDIASRADYGMTRAAFDALMPQEFWREVVDRAAVEAPDTLLLAEAFWLMEGYFVRTLGMHRVYNSAFMNILRDEENAKYRQIMKNTLEFDPEILKRYVNFMNNPDEKTALEQFGKGDKYFGICTLMVTMPGLPMLGHGQVEGFGEKYGMEYQRAYWDEQPDPYLVQRHEREIFPLLHKRYLFAGVENFLLYDFFTADGGVNEEVFAYSNMVGNPASKQAERALVVFHNKYASARGWVRTSVAFSLKTGQGDERALVQRTLGEGLALPDDESFVLFRDQGAGLEYLRASRELREQGLYIELGGYGCHVLLDFRIVQDNEWRQYANLASYLDGRGVPSIAEALKEIFLQPIHEPFKELVNAELFRKLIASTDASVLSAETPVPSGEEPTPAAEEPALSAEPEEPGASAPGTQRPALLDDAEQRIARLLDAITQFSESAGEATSTARHIRALLEEALSQPATPKGENGTAKPAAASTDNLQRWGTLLGWLFLHRLGAVVAPSDVAGQSRSWIDEWLLGRVTAATLRQLGLDEGAAAHAVALIKCLTSHQRWFEEYAGASAYALLQALLTDTDVQQVLRFNRHQGVLWFNKETCEQLLDWLLLTATLTLAVEQAPEEGTSTVLERARATLDRLLAAVDASGYQVEKLQTLVRGTAAPAPRTTR
jgi:glycosidase